MSASPGRARSSAGSSGSQFGYLRQALIAAVVVSGIVFVAAAIAPKGGELQKEGGILESLSVLLWMLAAAIAIGAALQKRLVGNRGLAFWMGCVAGLAGLRELDLHVWLNPDHLGSWGVRFRLDWWWGGSASLWLKLGWATVFVVVAGLLTGPPLRLHRQLLRRLQAGEVVLGLLALSVIFLVLGFLIDDLLRAVRIFDHRSKQLFEETCELVGAAFYATSTLALWQRPTSAPRASSETT